MFCQIGRCLNYCRQHNRILLLDTASVGFGEPLTYYLEPPSGVICDLNVIESILQETEADVLPDHLQRLVRTYRVKWNSSVGAFTNEQDNIPITFDFEAPHDQRLLVHHGCGGGMFAKSAMQAFSIGAALRELFLARRAAIPEKYAGVHVRHTDYKTNFMPLFDQLAEHELIKVHRLPIYVATDNPEVLDYARSKLRVVVYNFARLIPVEGSLHRTQLLPRSVINTDAFCDIFALASAAYYVASPMVQGSYSGFTVLSNHWFNDKNGLSEFLRLG